MAGRRGPCLRWRRRNRGGGFAQGGGGLPLPGHVVGQRGGEAGVADQEAGHLVVAQVVDRRRGQDEVGPDPPQGLGDPPTRLVVVEDGQVAELQAEAIGPDQVGRRPRLGPADLGDRLGVVLGAAAIAGRHRRQRQVTARLAQERQRPGALELDIVGVGVQRQHSDGQGHGNLRARRDVSSTSTPEVYPPPSGVASLLRRGSPTVTRGASRTPNLRFSGKCSRVR